MSNVECRKKSTSVLRAEKIESVKKLILENGFYDVQDEFNEDLIAIPTGGVINSEENENEDYKNYTCYLEMSEESEIDCGAYNAVDSRDADLVEKEMISDIINECQVVNYNIDSFRLNVQPLDGNRNNLFHFPIIENTSNLDSDIFYIAKLREESKHPGGVVINVRIADIVGLRIVVSQNKIWVARCPKINKIKGNLHVGDQIISLNDVFVTDLNQFIDFVRSTKKSEDIKLRLLRLPKGRVFALTPHNYNSVIFINPINQLVSFRSTGSSNWMITEIDGISIEDLDEKENLENYFMKEIDQFIPIIVHKLSFIREFLKLKNL